MHEVLGDGTVVIDGTEAVTQRDVRAFQQQLAEWEHQGKNTIHVVGELDCDATDWLEHHDAVGRLAVRFNVFRIISVGDGARHVHNAAGLEGSWDGQSLLVSSLDDAYDEVSRLRGPQTVVLITGSPVTPMTDLVATVKGDSA